MFSRYPLITRITFYSVGLVAVLTVAALLVLQYVESRRILSDVGDELMTGQSLLKHELSQQQDLLRVIAFNLAETRPLCRVMGTTDPDSMIAGFIGILSETELDMIQLEKQGGTPVKRIYAGGMVVDGSELAGSLSGSVYYHDQRYLYQLGGSSFETAGGQSMNLFIGKRIDVQWVRHISRLTRSDIGFYTDGLFLATSIDSTLLDPLEATLPWPSSAELEPTRIRVGNIRSLVMCEMLAEANAPALCALLIRNLEPEFAAIRQVQLRLILLGLIVLIIAGSIGGIGAWQMIRSLSELVRASEAMEHSDHSYPLTVKGSDEISRLTQRFIDMRQALSQRHAALRNLNIELNASMEELKKTQKQLVQSEKLAAMGRLTAHLSHELNNPICNIRNCAEVLRKLKAQDEDAREYIDLIHDEVLRMSNLTRQLLDFHRPARERMEPTDVTGQVEAALKLSGKKHGDSGIRIERKYAENIPLVPTGSDLLKQVFLNLILNAVDAMPEGGTLTLSTEADDREVRVGFTDTGIGMDEETRERIFEAFFTTKSEVAGVGLGLTVSYHIVLQHGGWIGVESKPGKGSTFTVHLPLTAPLHAEAESEAFGQ